MAGHKKTSLKKHEGKAGRKDLSEAAAKLHNGACQTLTCLDFLASVTARKLKAADSDAYRDVMELRRLVQRTRAELLDFLRLLRRKR